MTKTYLVSFSTEEFQGVQHELINSAKKYGITDFFSFTRDNLVDTDFFNLHQEIFTFGRGFGYWLWKPYFILEVLNRLNENEVLIYADSGCLFIADPKPLIQICQSNQSGVVAFDASPLTNNQWCKRDCFVITDCDTAEFWQAPHVIATTILFRKCDFTIKLVEEWLEFSKNVNALTEKDNIYGNNLPGFRQHMGDQPIFSLLVKKHRLETYRNPSKWGNFLKMEEFRKQGEFVGFPYLIENTIQDYSTESYANSPYDTIFEFNRKQKIELTNKSNPVKTHEKILKKVAKYKRKFFN